MNKIRAIQALNQKEIEQGVSPNASWHTDYRDTAFIYFGGLPYELSEGDIITIFSQFGEPVFLKLVRDKETGKSKGFGWLKYEDQRSTDLAVDNLGGAEIGGRLVGVDHARYKARDDEDPAEFRVGWEDMRRREGRPVSDEESSDDDDEGAEPDRPLLPEEQQLATLMREHDDDDPMKAYLIEEKRKEVDEAKRKAERREKRHAHRHHRSHRSRRDDGDEDRPGRSRRDDGDEGRPGRSRRDDGDEGRPGRSRRDDGEEGRPGRSRRDDGDEGRPGRSRGDISPRDRERRRRDSDHKGHRDRDDSRDRERRGRLIGYDDDERDGPRRDGRRETRGRDGEYSEDCGRRRGEPDDHKRRFRRPSRSRSPRRR